MPNYTWNYISANPDTIVKMKKKYYASEERPFDFNKLVPMPESLDVESGSSNDLDIYYYLSEKLSIPVEEMKKHSLTMLLLSNHFSTEWIDEIYKRIVKRIKAGEYPNYETGRTLVDNWKKYGAKTWYEWCNKNWGTKWNAFEVCWNENSIEFTTAWRAPEPIFKKMCEDFPGSELLFTCEYEEGYTAIYEEQNGKLKFIKCEENYDPEEDDDAAAG